MNDDNALLIHFLTGQGHSWPEIERVIAKLSDYESRTVRESVFDSIERGSFSLDDIIAEARDDHAS